MKKSIRMAALVLSLLMCLALCACGEEQTPPGTSSDVNLDEITGSPAPEGEGEGEVPPEGEGEAETADDLAYITGNGKMIIGYTVYEPMNYTDENGVFTGFDTELATAVCEKLGVEPEFVIINWDTKEVALAAKDIDCIWNGMTLNAEREANMACTVPYVKNAQVVVVKEGFEYTDTSSLIGGVVCAEIGSAGELLIKGDAETEPDANLAQAEYAGKSVQTDCLMEVKANTADAAVLDLTLAKSMTGEGTDYDDLVIVDYLAEENYGVAFRQGSNARDEVNAIFAELVADGTMQTLADKYGLELAEAAE